MELNSILPLAEEILNDYDLCKNCLGRMFAKKLGVKSNKNLGKKIHSKLGVSSKKCYICKNIFSNLSEYVELAQQKTADYQFSNFVVGTIIRPSIVDRDDNIRSKFRLRGIDSVKTDITKEITKSFSRRVRKKVDHFHPDLTITLDLRTICCTVNSKSCILFGRYLKTKRGLPQKQTPCDQCLGKGCRFCNYNGMSGFDSVEGIMSKYLLEMFDARKTRFTWIGGEDKNSLVKGNGRPFFVQVLDPKKRKMNIPKRIPLGNVTITQLKEVSGVPTTPVTFTSKVDMVIKTNENLSLVQLNKLKDLVNAPLTITENKGKRSRKQIYSLKHKQVSQGSAKLTLVLEGGIPIKRLVEGNNIEPCISGLLGSDCTCERFDFVNVTMNERIN